MTCSDSKLDGVALVLRRKSSTNVHNIFQWSKKGLVGFAQRSSSTVHFVGIGGIRLSIRLEDLF